MPRSLQISSNAINAKELKQQFIKGSGHVVGHASDFNKMNYTSYQNTFKGKRSISPAKKALKDVNTSFGQTVIPDPTYQQQQLKKVLN
jgi:hypothetical protein